MPRHTHETPHFILITQGVYVTEARNHNGLCSPGTLIFNPAGTTHRDCFRSAKGSFLSISVGKTPALLLDHVSPVSTIVAGRGIYLLEDSSIEASILRELREGLLESLGVELIACLAGIEERAASRKAPRWLVWAKEMAQDCACDDLQIADLALAAGVHPVYLARAYRRYYKCSPGEHVRRCRLLRVQNLLSKTKSPAGPNRPGMRLFRSKPNDPLIFQQLRHPTRALPKIAGAVGCGVYGFEVSKRQD